MDADTFLARLSCLRRFASGGLRAPHKPLLILFALGRLKHGRDDAISYCDADAILAPLLRIYGPTGTRARTADPFGRLESDGIWRIQGDCCGLFDRGGNLRPAVLRQRNVVAGFSPEVLELLLGRSDLIDAAARQLLDANFPLDLHDDILVGVGLQLGALTRAPRDPAFRQRVLDAYLHACAACGFSLRQGDALVGVDAAHIRWHALGGPSDVPNGVALCALHHKLLDLGTITIGLDYRFRVAHGLNGVSARRLLDEINGRLLDSPRDLSLRPAETHLRWHHEQVFRGSTDQLPE